MNSQPCGLPTMMREATSFSAILQYEFQGLVGRPKNLKSLHLAHILKKASNHRIKWLDGESEPFVNISTTSPLPIGSESTFCWNNID